MHPLLEHPVNLTVHSTAFVERWRAMLVALYGYAEQDGALLVPGIMGRATAVYLPLLNYSDLSATQAEARAGRMDGGAFQLRSLEALEGEPRPNETVTMRLDIADLSAEEVFQQRIPSKCRNQVRKGEKSGLRLVIGFDADVVDAFYDVFADTMHRHGTPVFDKALFALLPDFVDTRYLVAYVDDTAVAALCLVMDDELAWVPWAGSLMAHRTRCPNHFLYWNAIKLAVQGKKRVFDFGRSGYLAPTYRFKAEWGARPARIVLRSDKVSDPYARYALASEVWKRLPRWLVDRMGPALCRYLPDL
jgi:Acetyltransferase (GNAT) domain